MEDTWYRLLSQLATASPLLIVCLVGFIVALANWGRYPRACLCILLGLVLIAVSVVAPTLVFNYLLAQRDSSAWASTQFGWLMWANSFFWSLVRAAGTGLLLLGVFLDRQASNTSRRDEDRDEPDTPPRRRLEDENAFANRPRR